MSASSSPEAANVTKEKPKICPLAFLSSLLVTGGSPPDFNLFLSTLWHSRSCHQDKCSGSEIFFHPQTGAPLGVNLIQ